MRYKLILIAGIFLFALNASTQNKKDKRAGYRIEVNIQKNTGDILYLANFYDGAIYSIDSVAIPSNGKVLFVGDNKLPQGQYLIYKKPDVQMEMLLGEEQDNIRIDLDNNDLQNSKISGSNDTKLFWDYINHVNSLSSGLAELDSLLNSTDDKAEQKKILDKKADIEGQIFKYAQSQASQYSAQWFGTFLKGTLPVELPIKQPASIDDVKENKDYLRKHFFDNINLTDVRLWNTKYFPEMVDHFLFKEIPQIPDTVALEASNLVAKTVQDSASFREMLSHILNKAMLSKYMGMENVWAKLAEDYIFDKKLPWIEAEKVSQIRLLYEALQYNRIGMDAVNLRLVTVDGDTINTNDIKSDFTILYFFNPTCTHCQHTTPLLADIYKKYKDRGVRIITVNIDNNAEMWKNYVTANNISEWINCADPAYKSAYWMYYDTSAVPMIYVLDKNKKIIARKVDGETLDTLFSYYLK